MIKAKNSDCARRTKSIKPNQSDYPLKSDEDLLFDVARYQDRDAFEALFQKYQRPAYQLATYLTRNSSEAEDAVQDAMMALWRSAGTFKGGNPKGWIMRIVANHSLKTMQRKRNTIKLEDNARQMKLESETDKNDLELKEQSAWLRKMVERLPAQERRMVALYFGCNCSQDEMAGLLAIPQRTISKRLKEILKRLRTHCTTAGFSASLLSSECFFNAINTGVDAPNSLINLVTDNTPPPKALSAINKYTMLYIASGACVLGSLIAAFTFASNTLPQTTSNENNSGAAKHSTPVILESSNDKRILKTWDFNTSTLADFKTCQGEWQKKPSLGWKGSGCLQVNTSPGTAALLVPVQNFPILVSCRYASAGFKDVSFLIVRWQSRRNDALVEIGNIKEKPPSIPIGKWMKFEAYITGHMIDSYYNAKRNRLEFQLNKIPTNKFLMICGFNCLIDDLVISEIPDQNAPDVSLFQQAIENLTEPQKRGRVYFPDLPCSVPGAEVFADFSSLKLILPNNYIKAYLKKRKRYEPAKEGKP